MKECFQTQQGHGPDELTGIVTTSTNLNKTEQPQILAWMEEKLMQSHPSLWIYWLLTTAGGTGFRAHGPDEVIGIMAACTNLNKTEKPPILAQMEEKLMLSHPSLRIYWLLTTVGGTGFGLVRVSVPKRLSSRWSYTHACEGCSKRTLNSFYREHMK